MIDGRVSAHFTGEGCSCLNDKKSEVFTVFFLSASVLLQGNARSYTHTHTLTYYTHTTPCYPNLSPELQPTTDSSLQKWALPCPNMYHSVVSSFASVIVNINQLKCNDNLNNNDVLLQQRVLFCITINWSCTDDKFSGGASPHNHFTCSRRINQNQLLNWENLTDCYTH